MVFFTFRLKASFSLNVFRDMDGIVINGPNGKVSVSYTGNLSKVPVNKEVFQFL